MVNPCQNGEPDSEGLGPRVTGGPAAAALLQGKGRLPFPRPEGEHGKAGFMKAEVTPIRVSFS